MSGFSEPASARTARQLGSALITETVHRRPEIGFTSYERLFPNQDTIPLGGFGHLIAVPLQHKARKLSNSDFVDADMRPYNDQWAFLSSLPRLSAEAVNDLAEAAEFSGRVLGIQMPVDADTFGKPNHLATRDPARRLESTVRHASI